MFRGLTALYPFYSSLKGFVYLLTFAYYVCSSIVSAPGFVLSCRHNSCRMSLSFSQQVFLVHLRGDLLAFALLELGLLRKRKNTQIQ